MKYLQALVIVLVGTCALSAHATFSISGSSTATLVTDPGPYEDWYLYEMDLTWELETVEQGFALSHWSLLLLEGCATEDHLFAFPDPAGYSNSEEYPEDPFAVVWGGIFMPNGDPSADPQIYDPLLKYQPVEGQSQEPNHIGSGTFWFYANIIPEDGTHLNVILTKAGEDNVWGDLTGAWPSCTIIPEPATMTLLLLGLGSLALLRRRRK